MEYKCLCGKKLNTLNSLSGHKAKCFIYREWINSIFEQENIKEWISNKSANSFAEYLTNKYKTCIVASTVILYCKNNGIKTHTIKEAKRLPESIKKTKETCIKKYGSENCLGYGTAPFLKRNATVKNKYGVENVFQLNEVKEKSKKTCLEKYGVENTCLLSIKNVGRESIPQKIVEGWLSDYDVSFISEHNKLDTRMFNPYLNRYYRPRPDIYLPDTRTIIEVYGDRWHANPKIFLDEDIIYKWQGEASAKEIREKDKARECQLNQKGFDIIVIWASDITRNNSTHVREKLMEIIKCKKLKLNQLEKLSQKPDTIYL